MMKQSKTRKRWKSEGEILVAIDKKRVLEKKHIKSGYECELLWKDRAKNGLKEAAAMKEAEMHRHYRRAALIAGQLKTLQGKLAEFRTIPLFPEVMGDGSVQR